MGLCDAILLDRDESQLHVFLARVRSEHYRVAFLVDRLTYDVHIVLQSRVSLAQ